MSGLRWPSPLWTEGAAGAVLPETTYISPFSTRPVGSSFNIRFCDPTPPDSSAHLPQVGAQPVVGAEPEVGAQPAATVPGQAWLPRFLSVLTEAPLGKGGRGLNGQELGTAVNL